MLTTSGPSSANPSANAAFSVSVKMPFAASSWLARHDLRDHRGLGGREEHGHGRDEDVEQQDEREVGADEEQRDERHAAQDVRRDEDQSAVDPVDVDAGDRREQDRRDEERQDQQADRGVGAASSRRR